MDKHTNVAFVFVVCGEHKHIQTLNFSLHALKKFTPHEIIVVSDLKRNEADIHHNHIIDIRTPSEYNHHQASIWLKTSLHRILPLNKVYAYLDSDVIALNNNCNRIFEYYQPPITFAHDHTTISYFSPYAVNCNCYEKFVHDKNELETIIAQVIHHPNYPASYSNTQYRKLLKYLHSLSTHKISLLKFSIICALSYFKPLPLNKNILINIRKKHWLIDNRFEYPIVLLFRKSIQKHGYLFSLKKLKWFNKKEKRFLYQNQCHHLTQALKNEFNIHVDENYHHWNGGVFLFSKESYNFLEQWHQNTLSIFSKPYWKTRDQATLILTAHQFGIEKHATIPEKYNFIADFYKPHIFPHPTKLNSFYKGNKIIVPSFIHVYHHFADKSWDIWQRIDQILESTT